ncbi:hypothetical protein PENTCL1PPCAC_13913, partial [Pristionchus entomophagus]
LHFDGDRSECSSSNTARHVQIHTTASPRTRIVATLYHFPIHESDSSKEIMAASYSNSCGGSSKCCGSAKRTEK